eukprot:TRINITY_DN77844_c0_g1_i1.p1 TRINITY_DN77844_c0_g1~~TRINITY_DN77844_c0_g1_i1.p1  ORF type:complete len:690 (-),score=134.65 TRINITY_DN77844_c0_g1_i1:23-2092(-)
MGAAMPQCLGEGGNAPTEHIAAEASQPDPYADEAVEDKGDMLETLSQASGGISQTSGRDDYLEGAHDPDSLSRTSMRMDDAITFMTKLHKYVGAQQIPKLCEMADENGNGMLEWDEFQEMAKKVMSLRSQLSDTSRLLTSKKAFVPLSGLTLQASMKMRCDTTGASYCIYWGEVDDKLVVAGSYVTLKGGAQCKKYASACQKLQLDESTMLGKVAATREAAFISDVETCAEFTRAALCKECGIKSACIIPFEDGVLEYGSIDAWDAAPQCPTMPKAEMKRAFEHFGASYLLFWVEKDGEFEAVAEYTTPQRKKALRNRRGDNDTFASRSQAHKLGNDSMVYQADFSRSEVYIPDASDHLVFTRSALAKEFGIKAVRMLPCEGGILEYGVPQDEQLSGYAMEASMKMRCDTSDAVYCIYWVEINGQHVVAGFHTTPDWVKQLGKEGISPGYAIECQKYKMDENTMIAAVNRSGEAAFVKVSTPQSQSGFTRTKLCKKYGVKTVFFTPTTGGVLEYGCTQEMEEPPQVPTVPKMQLKAAFGAFGASYVMIWVEKEEEFVVAGSYTIPERTMRMENGRGSFDTFCSKCSQLKLDENSSVALVSMTGVKKTIEDLRKPSKFTDSCMAEFMRMSLAKEFGIDTVTLIPCEKGVIFEYGRAAPKSAAESTQPERNGMLKKASAADSSKDTKVAGG